MMFNFAVRHLRWLAYIPPFPQIFDAFLLASTALFRRKTFIAVERFQEAALAIPNLQPCTHRFGGLGFKLRNLEFAHIHGNGLLDVQLTRAIAERLIHEGRAQEHHVFGPSKWISFWIKSENDIQNALSLLKIASKLT